MRHKKVSSEVGSDSFLDREAGLPVSILKSSGNGVASPGLKRYLTETDPSTLAKLPLAHWKYKVGVQ